MKQEMETRPLEGHRRCLTIPLHVVRLHDLDLTYVKMPPLIHSHHKLLSEVCAEVFTVFMLKSNATKPSAAAVKVHQTDKRIKKKPCMVISYVKTNCRSFSVTCFPF